MTSPEELQRGWRRCAKCSGPVLRCQPGLEVPGRCGAQPDQREVRAAAELVVWPRTTGMVLGRQVPGSVLWRQSGCKCGRRRHNKARARQILVHNTASALAKGWRWCSKCRACSGGRRARPCRGRHRTPPSPARDPVAPLASGPVGGEQARCRERDGSTSTPAFRRSGSSGPWEVRCAARRVLSGPRIGVSRCFTTGTLLCGLRDWRTSTGRPGARPTPVRPAYVGPARPC